MLFGRRPRPRRTWPQRLVLVLSVLVMGAALSSAVVLAFASDTVSSIPRTAFGNTLSEEVTEGEPRNFLLVGVDSVASLPDDHPLRQTRAASLLLSDTLMLLRVDPDSGQASVLSIPRDLWVPIGGDGGREGKINSALSLSGKDGLVTTIQDYLDVPIHHYVQVDFNGFLELIEVLDGMEVFVEYPLRDSKAQLDIAATGCITLTPEQSLGYVRSRTLQAQIDGTWQRVDQRSDLGRIERQQDFLVLALKRAFDRGVRNPSTLQSLVDDVFGGGFVGLDDRLTIEQVLQLGRDFQDFNADSLDRHSLPVELDSVGEQSIVRLVEGRAEDVLDIFRGVGASDGTSARVAVLNGTGSPGVAATVGGELDLLGFRVGEEGDAESFDYQRTTLRFDPSQREAAEELLSWVASGAALAERSEDSGGRLELIIGLDWAGLRDTPRGPADPVPGGTAVPESGPTDPVETGGETTDDPEVVVTDGDDGDPDATVTPTDAPSEDPDEDRYIRPC